MPKARRICCVPGCDNTPQNASNFSVPLKFYKFPNDGPFTSWRSEKRQRWIDAVALKNKDGSIWQPTKNTFICSAHFVGGEKSENPLGPSYVPTIFPISYGTLNNSKASERIATIFRRTELKVPSAIETSLNQATNSAQKASVSNAELFSIPDSESGDNSFPKSQSKMMHKSNTVYIFRKSVRCQANLPQDKQYVGINCFICNMKVENNVCTAEVQANIANTVDRAIECNFSLDMMKRRDVACGPSAYDKQESPITGFQGISSIKNDAELTDFCGITFATFELLLSILPDMSGKKLNAKNKLVMFLMKLRLDLTYSALAVLFNVHRSTVLKTFIELLQCLPVLLKEYVYWPNRETVQKTLPHIFRTKYPNCRVVIDCTEIRVETPSTVEQKMSMYSNHKETFTMKFLLGCTPNGFICFKSKCYGGKTSDGIITNESGFLNYIESGDVVLSNKGSPSIKTDVEKKDAVFVTPPFGKESQFSSFEMEETRKICFRTPTPLFKSAVLWSIYNYLCHKVNELL